MSPIRKRVSLVIPAYNEERHLRACLEAVAAQTVAPFEVIVVDNNSTDGTAAIARSFPFVRVLPEKRQGRVFARDRGFNAAQGEIIGRIDADTMLPKNWVAHLTAFYEKPTHAHSAWTGGSYIYNARLPRFQGWLQGQVAFRWNRLLMGHYILYGSNMAVPRSVWQAVRSKVCRRTDIHEDLDLAIHLHQLRYPITFHESVRVGVYIRRILERRNDLLPNLMLWPQTLRTHGNPMWVFGWLGAVLLWFLSPIELLMDGCARLAGRPSLRR